MIKINDVEILKMPSSYNDEPEKIKTDSYSINGTVERQRYTPKNRVKLIYDVATPELVQYFESLEAGGAVKFFNDGTVHAGVLEFEGIITDIDEGDYLRGQSLLLPLTITIREV